MSDFDKTQKLKALFKESAKAIHDLRFIQSSAMVSMDLKGEAYLEAKVYMNGLADLQTRLEKEMLE